MQIGTSPQAADGSGRKRHTRRLVVAALAVAGGLVAAASSLGAIDRPGAGAAENPAVGPGNAIVSACDADGVRASFPTEWDATDSRFEISMVTVSGVSDACDGRMLEVTLTNSGDAAVGKATMAIPSSAATSFEVTLANAPSAESAEAVHIVLG